MTKVYKLYYKLHKKLPLGPRFQVSLVFGEVPWVKWQQSCAGGAARDRRGPEVDVELRRGVCAAALTEKHSTKNLP